MKLAQQSVNDVFGKVDPPESLKRYTTGSPGEGLSAFFTRLMEIVFVGAGLIFIIMLIMASYHYMTAGGDKDVVAKARLRILNATIGLVILALSLIFARIVGHVTGFQIVRLP